MHYSVIFRIWLWSIFIVLLDSECNNANCKVTFIWSFVKYTNTTEIKLMIVFSILMQWYYLRNHSVELFIQYKIILSLFVENIDNIIWKLLWKLFALFICWHVSSRMFIFKRRMRQLNTWNYSHYKHAYETVISLDRSLSLVSSYD